MLYPDVFPFFEYLSNVRIRKDAPTISVGVITNSDGRVPGVLSSLGLRVRSKRKDGWQTDFGDDTAASRSDIDFVATSYDVGTEKPASGIFEAASRLSDIGAHENVQRIHVGDGLATDCFGAVDAGWQGIFLRRTLDDMPLEELRPATQHTKTSREDVGPNGGEIPTIQDLRELRDVLSLSRTLE